MKIKLNLGKKQMFFIILLIFISGISGVIAVVPNPGHSWTQMECDNSLCITSGKVGVGLTNPTEKLDVQGNIKIGQPAATPFPSILFNHKGANMVKLEVANLPTSGKFSVQSAVGAGYDMFWLYTSDGSGGFRGPIEFLNGINGNINANTGTIYEQGKKLCKANGQDCPTFTCTTVTGTGSALCPSGYTMTGGGCSDLNDLIGESRPSGNGWQCRDGNNAAANAYVVCCKIA